MDRSGNPALSESTFDVYAEAGEGTMTLAGTATKTLFLFILLLVGAAYTWTQTMATFSYENIAVLKEAGKIGTLSSVPTNVWGYIVFGSLAGFVAAMVCIFVPRLWIVTWVYAGLEGICLGAFSAMFEYMYPGIALQAVGLTFGTFLVLLLAYTSGVVKATENFTLGVIAATGGICLLYLATIVLGMFGIQMPFIHETGWAGIGLSVFIVIIAALNLVLDFDFIEQGCDQGAPKYMEWRGAFGLMVTLVWLYLEILRLLAKLRSKD
jgi:uncharacterized YccA/Bax inhibitor family protein